ncbi:MAG: hypothetical protein CL927_06110 [Deltaproteobacteria bacterium]|nr:hypothetical protein [Deltaproteobacteria bacterium]HCH66365.1 hypothetical protein [Deltaproteobacteria bacterium]
MKSTPSSPPVDVPTGPNAAQKDLQDRLTMWRRALAEAVWPANPRVSDATLTAAVQRILDRVLFLRGIEARRLAPATELRHFVDSAQPWADLVRRRAVMHARYGGHLFTTHSADELDVPKDALHTLLQQTAPAALPFPFHTLDATRLGRAYESSLGQEFRRSAAGLTMEPSPDRRKSAGVFYTPRPIVELLCERVLGPLLEHQTPLTARKLRILDPACGAGAFLTGAFAFLLRWHKRWYEAHRSEVLAPGSPYREHVLLGADGTLQLSFHTRTRILQNCIYGIDIDPGAVEAARMSMAFQLLDGMTEQQTPFQRLPSFTANVECMDALDNLHEHFSEPFDAVLGNPPYVKEYQNRRAFVALRDSPHAHLYRGKMDLWYAFTKVSLDCLREGGRHGFIVQNNWPQSQGAGPFRAMIRARSTVESIIDFHDRMVFDDAGIQTLIYVLRKERARQRYVVAHSRLAHSTARPLSETIKARELFEHTEAWIDPAIGEAVMPLVTTQTATVLGRMAAHAGFQIRRAEVGQGIIGGPDAAFLHASIAEMNPHERALMHPHHTTGVRFGQAAPKGFLAYLTRESAPTLDRENLPVITARLDRYSQKLHARRETRAGTRAWHQLHWPRRRALFEAGPKLICPTRVRRPAFAVVHEPYYCSRAVNVVRTDRIDLYYLCGVLNSSAVHFWLKHHGKRLGSMLQIDTSFLLGIPIPDPATAPTAAEEIRRLCVALHGWTAARNHADEASIRSTERALDAIVGDLFGLSKSEQQRAQQL